MQDDCDVPFTPLPHIEAVLVYPTEIPLNLANRGEDTRDGVRSVASLSARRTGEHRTRFGVRGWMTDTAA